MLNSSKRWWDLLSVSLFLAALITVTYRLADTRWTDNLEIVIGLALIGAIIGLALGYSRFSPQTAGLFGFLFTLFFITWQLGELTPSNYIWLERLWLLGDRMWQNLVLFLRNQPLNDSILFLANMALLFWLVGISTGYQLTRYGKPWQGLVVLGIALVVIDLYHPPLAQSGVATAIFAVLALLLFSRMNYLKNARQWEEEEVGVDTDTGFNLMRSSLIILVLLVIFAWNAPRIVRAVVPNSPERQQMIQSLQSLRERFQNVTNPLRGSVAVLDEYYADEYALGTGSQLTDATVFTVQASITQRIGVPYYWRIRSYDYYDNGRWESTVTNQQSLRVGSPPLDYPQYSRRFNVRFDFRPVRNLSMVYVPGLPVGLNRNVLLVYDGSEPGKVEDVITVLADPDIPPGSTYQVTSSIASPTIAALREAGQDYPQWVVDRYLQLPDDLPQSIRDLAAEITAGLETPYDKAAAITQWLRDNIAYSATIPNPPTGRDPVEWVLFEHKQAFCNYYASAEVLMLRSLGIPSRWVIGYAQGFLDEEEDFYWVRDLDRHAWPEVFFPGIGWIEFEPTAFQSPIERPSGAGAEDRTPLPQPNPNQPQLLDEFEEATRFDENQASGPVNLQTTPLVSATLIILGLLIAGIVIFLVAANGRRRRWFPQQSFPAFLETSLRKRGWRIPRWLEQWSYYTQLAPVQRAFYSIHWLCHLFKIPITPAQTPAEQIQTLINHLPESETSALQLLQEYQKIAYSPYPADTAVAQQSARLIWKLAFQNRGKMILAKLGGKPLESNA
ncbi:transglutaminase domain-containing protein [Bellilinea sp.]|uniref:transglutaminase-like domain-containing protein n=1 Tax=Bellilinea sp. TaxID=2838785 RepID=UPI002ADE4E14|nr:transglutaminase domain-containing protein [Bellilinea sp.]